MDYQNVTFVWKKIGLSIDSNPQREGFQTKWRMRRRMINPKDVVMGLTMRDNVVNKGWRRKRIGIVNIIKINLPWKNGE